MLQNEPTRSETNYIAAELSKNNAGEQEAIEGYFRLLQIHGLPKELIDDIHEITSDEMNHSQILNKWVTRFTGVQPAKD